MYTNSWGEEIKPKFVDIIGRPIERTPFEFPYTYDEYILWKDESFNINSYTAVYSDRLWEWDSTKYDKCCQEVFKNTGQRFDNRKPELIEKFLSLYFEKEIKLTAIIQGCNQQSGFPYWAFLYVEKPQCSQPFSTL